MLQIDIDGTWEPADFIEVMEGLESLYYKCMPLEDGPFPGPYWIVPPPFLGRVPLEHLDAVNHRIVEWARYSADADERLQVGSISYASPGSIDLIGLSRAFESIERTIERIIRFYEERGIRRERVAQEAIETERKRETLRSLQIKNAREMLRLQREFGRSARNILVPLLVRDQEKLSSRAAEGKIVGVRRTPR